MKLPSDCPNTRVHLQHTVKYYIIKYYTVLSVNFNNKWIAWFENSLWQMSEKNNTEVFNILKIVALLKSQKLRCSPNYSTRWQQSGTTMKTSDMIKWREKGGKCLVDTDTCFINNTDLDRANKKLLWALTRPTLFRRHLKMEGQAVRPIQKEGKDCKL